MLLGTGASRGKVNIDPVPVVSKCVGSGGKVQQEAACGAAQHSARPHPTPPPAAPPGTSRAPPCAPHRAQAGECGAPSRPEEGILGHVSGVPEWQRKA